VVLILADDLDKSVFERSTLDSPWVPKGTSFINALATTPLCCPSRASILRGQYAHNTGLVRNNNDQPHGGAAYFRRRRLDEHTVATILQANGYKTWFGGRYLNGYGVEGEKPGYVPPGWDSWQAYLGIRTANADGRVSLFLFRHYTDWLSERADKFIEARQRSSRPFYMHIVPWTPTSPSTYRFATAGLTWGNGHRVRPPLTRQTSRTSPDGCATRHRSMPEAPPGTTSGMSSACRARLPYRTCARP
jgi:N-acetylglucosamine-6-sulfatase